MIETLLILAVLLADPMVAVSLSITVTVTAALLLPPKRALAIAFFAGWWADITAVRVWGVSSLALITLVLVLVIIREQFDLKKGWVAVSAALLAELITELITMHTVDGWLLVGQTLATAGLWLAVSALRPHGGVYLKN